jgi:hypothetical protein
MNLRKAKKIRKAVGFHPAQDRDYDRTSQGTVVAKGARRTYKAAKKAAQLAGLA